MSSSSSLEEALNEKESEIKRLRSTLQRALNVIAQKDETIEIQTRTIEVQTHFNPIDMLDKLKELREERCPSAMALKLLKEARVNELLTCKKMNELLDQINKMYMTDESTESSDEDQCPPSMN